MLLGAPVDGWIDGRGCVCDMEVSCRSAVAGLDTLLPLHTAVASARLKSCIAVDSTCWCSLSQAFAIASSHVAAAENGAPRPDPAGLHRPGVPPPPPRDLAIGARLQAAVVASCLGQDEGDDEALARCLNARSWAGLAPAPSGRVARAPGLLQRDPVRPTSTSFGPPPSPDLARGAR
ncbi:hypothetical protein ZWY2020_057717 [Hordeum vulgare]|nr:hypothetical protein ZWY2020_057717 [Hordeum vulgare]